MSEKIIYRTIELTDKNEFDKKISLMLNQGWKLVNSNHVENKYSQSLLYSYDDDKNEYVDFYDNDFISVRQIRTNDRLERIEYFDNGNIRFIRRYNEDDKRHGKWTEYKRNGRLLTELTYSDGELSYFNFQKNEDYHGSLFYSGDSFDLVNSQTEKLINPDNDSEQIDYSPSEWFFDLFGGITFNNDSKSFSGNLCFFKRRGIGWELDPDHLNKIFRQLLLMKNYNKSSLFFFEDQSDYGFDKDLFGKIDPWGEKRIRNPQPMVHFRLNHDTLTITSFVGLDISSQSEFYIQIIDETDQIKVDPSRVSFYQSNNLIIEYRNTKHDSFTFNKLIYEDPWNYEQNYPKSFFDISGELNFYNDNKLILSINDFLNVNPRGYDNYFSEDKKVDWTIKTEDSCYKTGELHFLCLSTDKEEMKLIDSRSWRSSKNNSDRSSNSKIIFKDIDEKVLYEEEYGRSGLGCPRDYDKDGIYHSGGTNGKPHYLIEVMYDKMFGWDSMNQKGLFGEIFSWILYPGCYSHSLWDFYHTFTGDGWIDNNRKSFDEFKFDMEVFLKKEKEHLEYYIEDS